MPVAGPFARKARPNATLANPGAGAPSFSAGAVAALPGRLVQVSASGSWVTVSADGAAFDAAELADINQAYTDWVTVDPPADTFPGSLPTGFDWVPLVGSRWNSSGVATLGSQVSSVNTAWNSPDSNRFTANAEIINANGGTEGYTWALDIADTLVDIGLTLADVMDGTDELVFFIRSNIGTMINGTLVTVGLSDVNTTVGSGISGGMYGDPSIGDVGGIILLDAAIQTGGKDTNLPQPWDGGGGIIVALTVLGRVATGLIVIVPGPLPGTSFRGVTSSATEFGFTLPVDPLYLVLNLGKNGVGTHTVDADFSVWIAKRSGLLQSSPS